MSILTFSRTNRFLALLSNDSGLQVLDLKERRFLSRLSLLDDERALQPRFSDDVQSIEFLSLWGNPSEDCDATSAVLRRAAIGPEALLRRASSRVTRALTTGRVEQVLAGLPVQGPLQ